MDRFRKRISKILKEIGEWMKKNESAVSGSRPWRKSREGTLQIPEGQFTDNLELPYTKEDIRFTVKGDSIYAFVMQYPEDGVLTIRSLADSKDQNVPEFHGLIEQIRVWDLTKRMYSGNDSEGLHLQIQGVKTDLPAVLRIQVK